ncbi:ComEA family DNA-binding protein [Rubrolithibacter danxiaensis]|uniref:ComEA family DNA-binding protein n=1 Tax=Rubrolithibacter danxiaensis TaxID=3390805 RepID=UPI003BF79E50
MNFKKLPFAVFLIIQVIASGKIAAQTVGEWGEELIESVAESTEEETDLSELTEIWMAYRKNPVDVNRITKEQLEELVFLSPLQIAAFMNYREESGKFIELLELQSIEGFDAKTVQKLLPMLKIASGNPFSNLSINQLLKKGQSEIIFRTVQLVEKQEGFLKGDSAKNSAYPGSPQKLLMQYRFNYDHRLSAGFTMEKDPGESFFSGRHKSGFDFYSGHVLLKSDGIIKKVIIGDYSLQFGQGLTLWSGLSFGKTSTIASIVRNDIGIKPYTSANEFSFFRGSAVTIAYEKISITPFVSYKKIDGSFTEDFRVKSLLETGLHRTATESENRKSIAEFDYGSVIEFKNKQLKLGAIIYRTGFNHSFAADSEPYKKFDFASSSLINTGLYYSYIYKNIYFFGEVAKSMSSGMAYQAGALVSLSPNLSLVVLKRSYQKNYHSFYNQALAESSTAVNEKGLYTGLNLKAGSKIEISAYADFFRFPWMKFRVDAPSKGFEILAQLNYSPNKKLTVNLRYKIENKEENDEEDNEINYLEEVVRRSYRAELSYQFKDLRFKNRLEISTYRKGLEKTESGYLAYHDIAYSPKSRFSCSGRFALFDTPGFNSRIYAYETDLLYNFSSPAFQNSGMRFYLNTRYRITRKTDVSVRYSTTNYIDINEIGSGTDKINGRKKSEIKLQLHLQL